MYVCNWSRFLLRRATLLSRISRVFFSLSLSLLFVWNTIKERNWRGLIFSNVRILPLFSRKRSKTKNETTLKAVWLVLPTGTSSGSLTLGLRLLAPGFSFLRGKVLSFDFLLIPRRQSPVVQRKKGFRAKWASTSSLRQKPIEKRRGRERW